VGSARGRAAREPAVPVAYALAHPGSLNTQLSVPGGSAFQVRVPLAAPLLCSAKVPRRWRSVHGGLLIFAITSGDTRCVNGAVPMTSPQRYLCQAVNGSCLLPRA
jgi:hypothetical protein